MKFYETHFEDYCKSYEKLLENDPTQTRPVTPLGGSLTELVVKRLKAPCH